MSLFLSNSHFFKLLINENNWDNLKKWYDSINTLGTDKKFVYIVGNKIESEDKMDEVDAITYIEKEYPETAKEFQRLQKVEDG